jgi:acetyl-CoA carboxylase carboxyltransferase component
MADESGKSLNKLKELKRRQEDIVQMGGLKAIEARHKKGQMSARERIDYFFDPGTFTEIGLFVKHRTTASKQAQRKS